MSKSAFYSLSVLSEVVVLVSDGEAVDPQEAIPHLQSLLTAQPSLRVFTVPGDRLRAASILL